VSITWDPSYETGNDNIDQQHRQLLAIVDGLESAEAQTLGSHDAVLDVLDLIMDYSLSHFAMEEELMAQVGYPSPAVEEMIQQHREFSSYARLRVLEFRSGELVSVSPLRAFLTEWLTDHVLGADKQLADFIHEQANTPMQSDEVE